MASKRAGADAGAATKTKRARVPTGGNASCQLIPEGRLKGKAPADCVRLELGGTSSCDVCVFGATVVNWKFNGKERLWVSKKSCTDGTGPIRGGVPIAFPQFGGGRLPLHGFARTMNWSISELSTAMGGDSASAVLTTSDSEATRAIWPHKFTLRYTVTLRRSAIILSLTVKNTGDTPFEFTNALHTYFAVDSIANCSVQGLQGCTYYDKVDASTKCQHDDRIMIAKQVDRVYSSGTVRRGETAERQQPTPRTSTLLLQEGAQGTPPSVIRVDQSPSFSETVVWNPWDEKAKAMADYDDEGYKSTVCIEAACATPVTIGPAERWDGSQCLTCF